MYLNTSTKPPKLSVIAAAIDDYPTIAEALAAVEDQTARAEIELIIVLDTWAKFAPPPAFAQSHPAARIIEAGRPLLLHEARALGTREATADYVFILEDHCLPAPDCFALIIEHIDVGNWAVIGPGFAGGNRHSLWGRAANLLTYGEWMGYAVAEERHFVAGYSSAWRRSTLKALTAHLEQELAIPSRLQQRLRRQDERLLFEPRALMWHWEGSYHREVCRILFRQGLGMGFVRQGQSSLGGKLRASLLVPALVGYRALRGAGAWWRTRAGSPLVLLAVPWLSLVWCLGELCGYWTDNPDDALRGVSEVEHRRQPGIDQAHEPIRRPSVE